MEKPPEVEVTGKRVGTETGHSEGAYGHISLEYRQYLKSGDTRNRQKWVIQAWQLTPVILSQAWEAEAVGQTYERRALTDRQGGTRKGQWHVLLSQLPPWGLGTRTEQ